MHPVLHRHLVNIYYNICMLALSETLLWIARDCIINFLEQQKFCITANDKVGRGMVHPTQPAALALYSQLLFSLLEPYLGGIEGEQH